MVDFTRYDILDDIAELPHWGSDFEWVIIVSGLDCVSEEYCQRYVAC